MFGLFDNVLNAAANIVTDVLDFEDPKRDDIVRLADAGLTALMIATSLGVAVEVVELVLAE